MGQKLSCTGENIDNTLNVVLNSKTGRQYNEDNGINNFVLPLRRATIRILAPKTLKEWIEDLELSNELGQVLHIDDIELEEYTKSPCDYLLLMASNIEELKKRHVIYAMMQSKKTFIISTKQTFYKNNIENWFTAQYTDLRQVTDEETNPTLLKETLGNIWINAIVSERPNKNLGTTIFRINLNVHLWMANASNLYNHASLEGIIEKTMFKNRPGRGVVSLSKWNIPDMEAKMEQLSDGTWSSFVYAHIGPESMSLWDFRHFFVELIFTYIQYNKPFPSIILSTTCKEDAEDLMTSVHKFQLKYHIFVIHESERSLEENLERSIRQLVFLTNQP
jgi:hypothetical protein